jgi:hypothetical protein
MEVSNAFVCYIITLPLISPPLTIITSSNLENILEPNTVMKGVDKAQVILKNVRKMSSVALDGEIVKLTFWLSFTHAK